MSDPQKSGDKPIPAAAVAEDTETTKALEEQAATEEQIAEEHLYKGDDQLTREEYDAVGKGENYEAKDWGPGTRPDDRTFAGTETPVAKPAPATSRKS